MALVKTILLLAINLFILALIGRILIEMIVSFSRNFRAPSWFTRCAELLFVVTDPAVKALRRIIPPLRMNNVSLDLSVLVLYIGLQFLYVLVANYLSG